MEGYVPRKTILDTCAPKVMLSKSFVAAIDIHATDLDQGMEFVTTSGAQHFTTTLTLIDSFWGRVCTTYSVAHGGEKTRWCCATSATKNTTCDILI